MSRTVTIVLATLKQALPAGVTFAGQYEFSIGAAAPAQVINGTTATFAAVPPGDYTATVQGLDSTGDKLGEPRTATFTVPVDGADMWEAPDSLSVTVGDAGA